jgi:hypothetical protein
VLVVPNSAGSYMQANRNCCFFQGTEPTLETAWGASTDQGNQMEPYIYTGSSLGGTSTSSITLLRRDAAICPSYKYQLDNTGATSSQASGIGKLRSVSIHPCMGWSHLSSSRAIDGYKISGAHARAHTHTHSPGPLRSIFPSHILHPFRFVDDGDVGGDGSPGGSVAVGGGQAADRAGGAVRGARPGRQPDREAAAAAARHHAQRPPVGVPLAGAPAPPVLPTAEGLRAMPDPPPTGRRSVILPRPATQVSSCSMRADLYIFLFLCCWNIIT